MKCFYFCFTFFLSLLYFIAELSREHFSSLFARQQQQEQVRAGELGAEGDGRGGQPSLQWWVGLRWHRKASQQQVRSSEVPFWAQTQLQHCSDKAQGHGLELKSCSWAKGRSPQHSVSWLCLVASSLDPRLSLHRVRAGLEDKQPNPGG